MMHLQRQDLISPSLHSNNSLLSILSGENGTVIQELQQHNGKQSKYMVKLLLAMCVPVLCLVTITAISVYKEHTLYTQVTETKTTLSACILVTNLIGALQRERGVSALYISSPEEKVLRKLTELRLDTDELLSSLQTSILTIEFVIRLKGEKQNADLSNLGWLIAIHRGNVSSLHTDAVKSINLYTTIITELIKAISTNVVITAGEDLWQYFTSITSFISATDSEGIQRAIGSIYFSNCFIPGRGIHWMLELIAQEEVHIRSAMLYLGDEKEHHTELLNKNASFRNELNSIKVQIITDDYQTCMNSTEDDRINKALLWFDMMTNYIDIILSVLKMDIQIIVNHLNEINRDIIIEFSLHIILLIVVVLGTTLLSVWYVKSVNGMTNSLNRYTQKMSLKKKEIAQEKKKTENILHQLLPRHVAEQLKQQKRVDAEYFSSVTIYFSDIVGFTSISAACTPHQVVDLLNHLYSTFDSTIEKYDVYKVETIGDAYMVVSGLPERNGIQHSKIIPEMSLELLITLEHFKTPNGETLQLRIGLHSGSVVAGVVGIKMPRYCLFGDTVNIAHSMESTGKASKIHISEVTNDLMQRIGSFSTEYMGTVHVPGKGSLETYWLLESLVREPVSTDK